MKKYSFLVSVSTALLLTSVFNKELYAPKGLGLSDVPLGDPVDQGGDHSGAVAVKMMDTVSLEDDASQARAQSPQDKEPSSVHDRALQIADELGNREPPAREDAPAIDAEWQEIDPDEKIPVDPDVVLDNLRKKPQEDCISKIIQAGQDMSVEGGWDGEWVKFKLHANGRQVQYIALLDKAWDRVGGAGTLYPDASGAYFQRTGRGFVSVTLFAAEIVLPFVFTNVLRQGFSYFFQAVTPRFVQFMGDRAAYAASEPSSSAYPLFDWFYKLVNAPFSRRMAEAQAAQTMVELSDFTLSYPKDVFYGLHRASVGVGNGIYAISSGVYSIGSSIGSSVSRTLSPPRVAPGLPSVVVDDDDD